MTPNELYQRPGFLLRRMYQIAAAVFENACADLGLTTAQYGVLIIVHSEPGIDQTRLARALAFDKVTVMRVLRGLEERGVVQRVASGRQKTLALTDAGQQLLTQARERAEVASKRLMSPLDSNDQAQLVRLLKTLVDGLADEARAPFVPLER
ncbi:MarR family winged helix-turn-helix transcriptional regulator [Hydrogenophaga sp. R2]|uniref:MarR family winged helix-turn-helix transcriptional regulator n=1 Tax=Hydrogenophaga sp. R2 TaxID=3132827 RepID=UPI003CFBA554